ncbi:MAG: alpha/beta fold hydrolase [Caulobacteraceae bacterium]
MGRAERAIAVVAGVIVIALVAAYLALQRPDIAWSTLEAKYGDARSRYMDLPDGVRVHYRDQGNPAGPPVVMVHGFSASLQAWEPWVARLGKDYRIVTLDLPGHGLTRAPAGYVASIDGYADLVDAVARSLKLDRYVVVGNSMGGAVAWDDALRHPGDVRGLVLVDAAGWPSKARAGGGPLIFRILGNPIGRALVRDLDMRPLIKSGLQSAYLDKSLVTPALVDRYVELSRAPGHRDILLTIRERPAGAPVTAETFNAIHVPTLVMHGQSDALIPVADGHAFAAAIPGARLIVYPGVGHVPMEQIPGRSAADLRLFLAGLGPS